MPEWTAGDAYKIDDIITQRGTIYRVIVDIPVAPTYPNYSTLNCISRGEGTASYRLYDTPHSANWINVANFPSYYAGTFSVGGLYNGKQMCYYGEIATTFDEITFDIWSVQHATGCLNELKLLQPANGQPWQLWMSLDLNAADWFGHFVSDGSGWTQMSVPDTAATQSTNPGGGIRQFYNNTLSTLNYNRWTEG